MPNKYLEKIAVTMELYKKPGAKHVWVTKGGKPTEDGYEFTGVRFHAGKRKLGQNLSMVKAAMDTPGELKILPPAPPVTGAGVKRGKMPRKDTRSTYSPDSPVKSTVELSRETLLKRAFVKLAYARTENPQEQQERVVNKLDKDHPRLIAFHSLGSGKTLTSLKAAQKALKDNPDKTVTFITPASLTKNVEKDAKKHGIKLDSKRVKILSYQKAVNQLDKLKEDKNSLLVLDEAHRLRNEDSAGFRKLAPIVNKADRVLLLSGSPMYNKPKDIGTLVNLAAGRKILPTDEKEFQEAFVKKVRDNPGFIKRVFFGVRPGEHMELRKDNKVLNKALKQYVDFYDARNSKSEQTNPMFPKMTEQEVTVPMSDEQQRMYQYYEGNLPAPIRWKIRMGIAPNKTEAARLNSFASALRQISNSHHPFTKDFDGGSSPKIDTAVSNLLRRHNQDKNFRGVVYSNYLASGINPYSKALQTAGINHSVFTGQLTAKEKAKLVEDYNKGKTKVLLVSSSGTEGLDLKGTKLVQVLEPHFNDEKIRQVIGRGVRYKSHLHLPPEERKVEVERYLSTIKPQLSDKILGIKSKSIDEYLNHYSKEKLKVSDQIKDLAEKTTLEG